MLLMKDIISDEKPILREKSEPVTLPLSKKDRKTMQKMLDYLSNSQNEEISDEYGLRPGVGMAAVQVGVLKRMCAILIIDYDLDGNETSMTAYGLINPKIISHSQKLAYLKDGEGCLSVNENHQGIVKRYYKVTVAGYDMITDQNVEIVARGYLSIVLQHELDHFEGKLFYDYIDPNNPYPDVSHAIEIE